MLAQLLDLRRNDGNVGSRTCRVLGIMTGTSLDGVDLALVRFAGSSLPRGGAPPPARALGDFMTVERFACFPYPPSLQAATTALLSPPHRDNSSGAAPSPLDMQSATLDAVCRINTLYAREIGRLVVEFLDGCPDSDGPVAVASHGQTLWHAAGAGTLQIGDTEVLSAVTRRVVVGNFRSADVALGGCGAPLVPFLDRLLAAEALLTHLRTGAERDRPQRAQRQLVFLLNLGGIGNVTAVAVRVAATGEATTVDAPEIVCACDTGPANVILNELCCALVRPGGRIAVACRERSLVAGDCGDWARRISSAFHAWCAATGDGEAPDVPLLPEFDRDSIYSLRGTIDEALLSELLRHPFVAAVGSEAGVAALRGRSTGREAFGAAFTADLIERHIVAWLVDASRGARDNVERWLARFCDVCRTVLEFSARCVAIHVSAITKASEPTGAATAALLACSGGGSAHGGLMARLSALTAVVRVCRLSDVVTVPGLSGAALDDAKEALAFALLGHEKLCQLAGAAGESNDCDDGGLGTNEPAATGATRRCFLGQVSSVW